jgi:hypothetical protein
VRGVSRHILICFHDFSRGGTERIAIGMARFWVEAGHRVTILCGTTEGGLRATVDPRVNVVELSPCPPQPDLAAEAGPGDGAHAGQDRS